MGLRNEEATLPAYFLSDLHLKDPNESNSIKLLGFFKSCLESELSGCQIFMVGDIFDLWVADHQVFAQKFSDLVEVIEACSRRGLEVHFFEGNHDLYLHRFWQDILGVKVHTQARYFKIGNQIVRVEHGDEINPNDRSYLLLKKVLRLEATEKLAYALPGSWIDKAGSWASHFSRRFSQKKRERDEEFFRQMIRDHALRSYTVSPFDLIVTGHMHVWDDWIFEKDQRTVRSVNLGSWLESPKIFKLNPQEQGEWLSVTF